MGGALGDAVGAACEGAAPGLDFDAHSAQPLSFTDDTQLTWATCEAILAAREVSPPEIAARMTAWFAAGRLRGLGASTLKALRELSYGGHWASCGATGEFAAGAGAAMRIAPLAFWLDVSLEADRRTLRDVCRITHRHDEAYAGALAMVQAIRAACLSGKFDHATLCEVAVALPDSIVRDRLTKAGRERWTPRAFAQTHGATGYAAESVPLALLAAADAGDARDLLCAVLACGGDTDTIAALAMQCFGAAQGLDALPKELLNRICELPEFRRTAWKFAALAATH